MLLKVKKDFSDIIWVNKTWEQNLGFKWSANLCLSSLEKQDDKTWVALGLVPISLKKYILRSKTKPSKNTILTQVYVSFC